MLTRYERVGFRLVLPVLFVLIAAIELIVGIGLVAQGFTVYWRVGGAAVIVAAALTLIMAWELHVGGYEEGD